MVVINPKFTEKNYFTYNNFGIAKYFAPLYHSPINDNDIWKVLLCGPQVPVDKGELMLTSGLQQSIFPPGVPIGTVVTSGVPRGSFQQAVTIAPVADLARLQFVAVMQWAPKS